MVSRQPFSLLTFRYFPLADPQCRTVTPERLAELLDRHWGPLVAWVGTCDGLAEDVVQQAFIALASQTVVPENPAAWLYKTSRHLAINTCKQHQRRLRRQTMAARCEQQPSTVWRSSQAAELVEKLNCLADAEREVVVAYIWGGLSFEEISCLVGTSRSTVWRHYQAALEHLRKVYNAPCKTNP